MTESQQKQDSRPFLALLATVAPVRPHENKSHKIKSTHFLGALP